MFSKPYKNHAHGAKKGGVMYNDNDNMLIGLEGKDINNEKRNKEIETVMKVISTKSFKYKDKMKGEMDKYKMSKRFKEAKGVEIGIRHWESSNIMKDV